jgi:hypothetical protein
MIGSMQGEIELQRLAATQHGLVGRWQVTQLGVPRHVIRRLVGAGAWDLPTTRVMRLIGSAESMEQKAMTVVLDAGRQAYLSHSSAAAWWEIPGFRLDPWHVTVHRLRTRRDETIARVHYITRISEGHTTTLHGIPILSPAFVLLQLAGLLHPDRTARALDTALAKGLVHLPGLRALHSALARRGRDGIVVMRELLEARPDDYVPAESNNERRLEHILHQAGERPLRRQVTLGDDEPIGRADFGDEELPELAVEVLSERYHSALLDRQADEKRFARYRSAGFELVVVWDWEIWYEPQAVVARIREARARLRMRRGAAAF